MQKYRSFIIGSRLGKEFWVEVADTSCYLVNGSPSSMLDDKHPYEVWTRKKPYHTHLKIFGCDAYVHIPNENITKFYRKFERCTIIGYKDGLKGYNLWNLETKKVLYN